MRVPREHLRDAVEELTGGHVQSIAQLDIGRYTVIVLLPGDTVVQLICRLEPMTTDAEMELLVDTPNVN